MPKTMPKPKLTADQAKKLLTSTVNGGLDAALKVAAAFEKAGIIPAGEGTALVNKTADDWAATHN